ncbi:MAG: 16S rRNA (adenine(1518)-N(6)/adenine(1519)-N(6))-dimethyltransferase RsmA [Bosea sp. (in: a-proteobacteria)]
MSTADGLPPLRDVVAAHGLMARRSLGQNFLFDLNLTGRIARSGGRLAGQTVVEVGPGPGGLTRALLLEGARKVIVIERDERCLPALREIAARWPGQLEIILGDAMRENIATHLDGEPAQIIANLPYNIGTALLVEWLTKTEWPPWYSSLTLMFQREVAERIVADENDTSNYGRLSVLCGWRTEASILFDVAPSAFVPPPKVTSSVVHLVPRATPEACDLKLLERVTQAAFGQRRKMLRQSLKPLGLDLPRLFAATGIDETARAENISVRGFVGLTNAASQQLAN